MIRRRPGKSKSRRLSRMCESVRAMGAGAISGIGVGDRKASRDRTCF